MDDKSTLHFYFSFLHLSNIFSQLIETQVSLVQVEVFIVKDGNYPTATFNEQGSRISELSLLGFPVLEFQRSRSPDFVSRELTSFLSRYVSEISDFDSIYYIPADPSLFLTPEVLYDINNSLPYLCA